MFPWNILCHLLEMCKLSKSRTCRSPFITNTTRRSELSINSPRIQNLNILWTFWQEQQKQILKVDNFNVPPFFSLYFAWKFYVNLIISFCGQLPFLPFLLAGKSLLENISFRYMNQWHSTHTWIWVTLYNLSLYLIYIFINWTIALMRLISTDLVFLWSKLLPCEGSEIV